MPSETSRKVGSWLRAGIALTGGSVIGVIVPVWLAVDLAVRPGQLTGDLPGGALIEEVSLGSPAEAALPIPPRSIAAVSIAPQRVRTLDRVFERYDYTLKAVAEARTGVPPILVERLPGDWRDLKRADRRKSLFVKSILPLILKANAAIRQDRSRMLSLIQEAGGKPENLSQGGRYWMSRLAHDYGLKEIDFAALKARVDIIPASLALAQAANESGWGTSRFVREGNALFGQWTWDSSQGIAPKDRQEGKGNYSVRSFPDLGGSVSAYMRNLNTHSAYKTLRKTRAAMRASGKAPSGHALAGGLLRYSQRGKAYVEEIRGMISYNDFQRFDSARLGDAVLG